MIFSWLYDESSNGYQYYQYLLKNANSKNKNRRRRKFSSVPVGIDRDSFCENAEMDEEDKDFMKGILAAPAPAPAHTPSDGSLDKMNAYISKLEESQNQKNQSRFDRSNAMSIHNGGSSHHIGHYLPPNALDQFNKTNENKLGHKNRGHALLKKLGWSEGQGLGRNQQGGVNPVSAMVSKKENNSGVGGCDANGKKPWDPKPDDDAFDLYKKKMMLSYRYRPNPLVCYLLSVVLFFFNCVWLTGKSKKGLLLK